MHVSSPVNVVHWPAGFEYKVVFEQTHFCIFFGIFCVFCEFLCAFFAFFFVYCFFCAWRTPGKQPGVCDVRERGPRSPSGCTLESKRSRFLEPCMCYVRRRAEAFVD